MRIVRWQFKILYVVVGCLVSIVFFQILPIQDTALVVGVAVSQLALIFVGARIFRGRFEDIRAPRAWWRMTSKRPLSARLGLLFSILSVIATVDTISEVLHIVVYQHGAVPESTREFGSAAVYAVLAFFYLNSAVRLNRLSQSGSELSTEASSRLTSARSEQPGAGQDS